MSDGRVLTGTYEAIRVTDDLVINVCDLCGAVVYALGRHTEWHDSLKPTAHHEEDR